LAHKGDSLFKTKKEIAKDERFLMLLWIFFLLQQ